MQMQERECHRRAAVSWDARAGQLPALRRPPSCGRWLFLLPWVLVVYIQENQSFGFISLALVLSKFFTAPAPRHVSSCYRYTELYLS